METNKYYVPEIEDFHVGFRYQLCSGKEIPTEDNEDWVDFIFGERDIYEFDEEGWSSSLTDFLSRKLIRVKYLDREDFELTGWTYNTVSSERLESNKHQMRGVYSCPFNDVRGNKYSLFHNASTNWVLIWASSSEHTHTTWDDKLSTMGETVFAGTVRNISELRKLMKMLGIDVNLNKNQDV